MMCIAAAAVRSVEPEGARTRKDLRSARVGGVCRLVGEAVRAPSSGIGGASIKMSEVSVGSAIVRHACIGLFQPCTTGY